MKTERLKIRRATKADHDPIWKIFRDVVAAGDTYAIDPKIVRRDAMAFWFARGTHTYVAELDRLNRSSSQAARRVIGTYILKANQAGGGSHVANAAFMVAANARGHGVGWAMAEHCLAEARRLGFRAMQFNFVVSTNQSAIRLWRKLGFEIVATLPGAFRHPKNGYVDVHIMFRSFIEESTPAKP